MGSIIDPNLRRFLESASGAQFSATYNKCPSLGRHEGQRDWHWRCQWEVAIAITNQVKRSWPDWQLCCGLNKCINITTGVSGSVCVYRYAEKSLRETSERYDLTPCHSPISYCCKRR